MAISSQAAQECAEGPTTSAWSPERAVEHHERAATKQCSQCGECKPYGSFEGNRSKCKRCRQDDANRRYALIPKVRAAKRASYERWVSTNPEQKRASDAKHYANYRDSKLREKKAYHAAKYAEKIRPYKVVYNALPEVIERKRVYQERYHVEYYAKNKAAYLAKYIARRSAKDRALPAWANLKKMQGFYRQARDMTEATGVRHEVDHIVPLISDTVCGLHVETNLRVITRYQNRKKSNRLIDDIV